MFELTKVDKALLNPSRFHIYLYLLRNGPKTVSDIAKGIEIMDAKTKRVKKLSKSAISKHCRILEDAGLLIPEALFKGSKGISKLYKATQRPRWEEFVIIGGRDPKELPDEVYKKMDELAQHPRYLKIVEEETPEIKDISLLRQKERLDRLLLDKKEEVFGRIEKDEELKTIFELGFKRYFRFLMGMS
ncbi:MAG: helix-turn-helix transcriptional regulator [Methanophagales archaeon]|nr:helix-turn-helix transcriptional regulator [Methanophagales archaeon]